MEWGVPSRCCAASASYLRHPGLGDSEFSTVTEASGVRPAGGWLVRAQGQLNPSQPAPLLPRANPPATRLGQGAGRRDMNSPHQLCPQHHLFRSAYKGLPYLALSRLVCATTQGRQRRGRERERLWLLSGHPNRVGTEPRSPQSSPSAERGFLLHVKKRLLRRPGGHA